MLVTPYREGRLYVYRRIVLWHCFTNCIFFMHTNSPTKILFSGLLMLLCTLGIAQNIVIQEVNIVDVKEGKILPAQTVIIQGNRIQKIGPKLPTPSGAQVISAKDKYLIPGLWDMHVHLAMIGEVSFPLFIANGVTGVRDMGSNYTKLKRWRIEEAKGKRLMPIFKTPGAILESPAWFNLVKGVFGANTLKKERIVVYNPAQAYRVIDSLKQIEIDFVKIRNVNNKKTFLAIADACQKQGLKLVGHLPERQISMADASKAGFVGLEHTIFFSLMKKDSTTRQQIYKVLKQNNTYFTPTLITDKYAHLTPIKEVNAIVYDTQNQVDERRKYLDPEMIEFWQLNQELWKTAPPSPWKKWLERFHHFSKEIAQSGVKILAGVDLPVPPIFPGWSLHEELTLLVKQLGLQPIEALQAATINPAEFMNLMQDYGQVAEGKIADLVLLNANPLEDITHTQKISVVFKNGQVYDHDAREVMLKQVEQEVAQKRKIYQSKTLNRYLAQQKNKQQQLYQKLSKMLEKVIGQKVAADKMDEIIKALVVGKYKFEEDPMLKFAYGLLEAQAIEKAAAVFETNLKAYPGSYRAYQGLADFLAAIGQKQRAIVFYKKALSLNQQRNMAEKKAYQQIEKRVKQLK